MREIPKLLGEFFHNMWVDFDYFSDFMVNGGIMIPIFLIVVAVAIVLKIIEFKSR